MDKTIGPVLNPMQEFRTKLGEKVRADIANLLPEPVIAQLVEEAVKESFFEPQKVTTASGYTRTEPSWFNQAVAEAAKPMMEAAVEKFVKENQAKMQEQIDLYVSDQNLTLLAAAAIGQQMNNNVYQVVENIMQRIR